MDRHIAEPDEDDQAENEAERADGEAAQKQIVSADAAQKGGRMQVGELEVGFTSRFLRLRHERRRQGEHDQETKENAPKGTVSRACGRVSGPLDTERVRGGDHRRRTSSGLAGSYDR